MRHFSGALQTMQIFHNPAQARQVFPRCVATIGKYDGMHLGHQRILDELLVKARAAGLPAIVILSEPQPEEFFAGLNAPPRLNHFADKVNFLEAHGIDAVYQLRFDQELSRQSAEEFVTDFLVGGLGIQSLVVGDDFRFGRNRGGDFALLQRLGQMLGFEVSAVAPCCESGERVSSTLVRQYLQAGDCQRAAVLLGRTYSISGRIIQGRQLGRQIGIPTANIELLAPSLPMTGVFAVRAVLAGAKLQGVANLGYKPTVSNDRKPSLEVHLLDYQGDIYGQTMRVEFGQRLRQEQQFASVALLQEQIRLDISRARAWFAGSGRMETA